MKKLSVIFAAVLLLCCAAGCAADTPTPAEPDTLPSAADAGTGADTPPEPAQEQSEPGTVMLEPEPEPAVPGDGPSEPVPAPSEAEYLPDFTVRTVDGGTFTLSEALKDHELVLINLFATWCRPCAMEFPALQKACTKRDDVAVIALSVEENDTLDALGEYADEMGLTIPIGREEGTDLDRFVTVGIPTTVLVDRTGRVCSVEVGAKTSVQDFIDLFDGFTGDDYDPDICTYTVLIYDVFDYECVEGAVLNFCTDELCVPVTSTKDGAVFTGPPARYHVQVARLPEGWELLDEGEFVTEPYSQTFWLPMTEAD